MNLSNLNLTQIVAGVVATAFGAASAALFLVLGLRGTLAPEFLGSIIGGVAVAAFHSLGIVIGAVTTSNSSAQGASQALSTPGNVSLATGTTTQQPVQPTNLNSGT